MNCSTCMRDERGSKTRNQGMYTDFVIIINEMAICVWRIVTQRERISRILPLFPISLCSCHNLYSYFCFYCDSCIENICPWNTCHRSCRPTTSFSSAFQSLQPRYSIFTHHTYISILHHHKHIQLDCDSMPNVIFRKQVSHSFCAACHHLKPCQYDNL